METGIDRYTTTSLLYYNSKGKYSLRIARVDSPPALPDTPPATLDTFRSMVLCLDGSYIGRMAGQEVR